MGTGVKVYLILNEDQFTKVDVIKILQEEGFQHLFSFGTPYEIEQGCCTVETAEEVWTFGDCKGISDFIMAEALQKDIWVMG